jgi:histone deacetylase complex regulatory component SIN3
MSAPNRRMDTPTVVSRVSQLFHGHDGLMRGFQKFLTGTKSVDANDPSVGAPSSHGVDPTSSLNERVLLRSCCRCLHT